MAVGALLWCLLVSIGLLVGVGSELDTDAVLPLSSGDDEGVTTSSGPGPSNDLPTDEVRLVFGLLVATTAVPVLAPRAAFRACLVFSMVVVGLFVLLTWLRLGLLFAPALALQIAAHQRGTTDDPAPRPAGSAA